MTKDQLKPGMFVKFRNGKIMLVLDDVFINITSILLLQ